jgi:hypothetical protein
MRDRHQMLRHLDAVWELRGQRQVFGFFIVEGDAEGNPPVQWLRAVRTTVEQRALDKSLPHRSPEERRLIADAFIGATTWQAVCRALWIPEAVLIERVE